MWTKTSKETVGHKKSTLNRKKKKEILNNSHTRTSKVTAQEEATFKRNMKELYNTTIKLAGGYKQANKQVKDKNGATLTTAEEQVKRWAEYFEELLNRPALLNAADIQPAEELLQVNSAKPTKDEVRKAIRTLKNGKSAEPDGIPAEALKADLSTSTNMLYEIIENIWEEEEIPEEWKEGYLVKLPKKGNLRECNYRVQN